MVVTIPLNSTNGTLTCFDLDDIVLDDNIIEGNESFSIQIMQTSPEITVFQPDTFDVNIEDKDGISIMLLVYISHALLTESGADDHPDLAPPNAIILNS